MKIYIVRKDVYDNHFFEGPEFRESPIISVYSSKEKAIEECKALAFTNTSAEESVSLHINDKGLPVISCHMLDDSWEEIFFVEEWEIKE